MRAIHTLSDGASFAASYVFFMVTCLMKEPLGSPSTQCWQVDSDSAIKNHSVPSNEASGLLLSVEGVAAFLNAHHEVLLRQQEDEYIQLSFGVDSSCLCSSLNPLLLHKSVLVRNIAVKVHEICADLSSLFRLEVHMYHTAGSCNIADYNSKVPANYDPVSLINSDTWRNGLPSFKEENFPHPDRVFMTYRDGEMTTYRQPVIDRHVGAQGCHCQGELCLGEAICMCFQCSMEQDFDIEWDILMGSIDSNPPENDKAVNINGLNLLKYVPDIPLDTNNSQRSLFKS